MKWEGGGRGEREAARLFERRSIEPFFFVFFLSLIPPRYYLPTRIPDASLFLSISFSGWIAHWIILLHTIHNINLRYAKECLTINFWIRSRRWRRGEERTTTTTTVWPDNGQKYFFWNPIHLTEQHTRKRLDPKKDSSPCHLNIHPLLE